jgi:hypothetical protein
MQIPLPPIRPIGYLLVASAVLGFGIDAGSVAMTRLAVPDDVREAGHAAAAAVEGMPVTRQAATMALDAAADEARPHGLKVRKKDFTLYPDGRISVTTSRTAPTLLDRISVLRHYTDVRSTATVAALPFS